MNDKKVIHYYDKNDALRSGYLIRFVVKGRRKGQPIVQTSEGQVKVFEKYRNVEGEK